MIKSHFFLLFLIVFSINIFGQEYDSVAFKTEIDELTVIGSIRADENTPVTVKNLDLPTIENISFGQELPTLLNNTQSVTTYSDAGNYYGYTYMRLRGIDQTRINFTLNGVPLNEPEDQGVYFNNYADFTNSIQSMQIQRGVGTSTNGVASFGGSVNFQSVSLAKPFAEFQYGLASYNTQRYSLEYCTGIQNNFSIYTRYSDIHSDGYRYNSANDSKSFYLSGGLFYSKDIITFNSFYGHQENQMAYLATSISDIQNEPRTNYLSPNERDNFKYLFNSVQYTTERFGDVILTSTLYYIRLDGNYGAYGDYERLVPLDSMYNYRLNSNLYGLIINSSQKFGDVNFDAGIHVNWYDRTHSSILEPVETDLYNNTGQKNEYSAFTKVSYDINGVTLYGDLQLRMINFNYIPDMNYDMSASINWTFLNPKVGIVYRLNPYINLYSSIGLSQREPTRLDMLQGYDDIDSSNYVDVGNLSNVQPEKVIDIEAGFKFDYDRIKFDINGFSMQFQNEIAAIGQLSEVYALPLRKNVPTSHRTGIETDFLWKITERFTIENNATFMNAVIDEYITEYDSVTYTDVVPLITPNVIVNTTFNLYMGLFDISLVGKYVSQSYLDNENTVKLPQYYIWDFVLKINMWQSVLDFRANNITNRQYYTGGYVGEPGVPYYYVQMPMNFVGTLKVRL